MLMLVLAGSVIASAADLTVRGERPPTQAEITFDEFMRLSPKARMDKFGTLSAAAKAHIKRTHGERWLAANRDRLSAKQIAATEAAIAFVTPDIYSRPSDPEITQRGEQVAHDVGCALGQESAREAFLIDRPPSGSPPTWRSTIDAWLSWFSSLADG
jgi:hypothetical protein